MTAAIIILAAAVLLMAMLLWTAWPLVARVFSASLHIITEQEAADNVRPLSHAVTIIDLDDDYDNDGAAA